MKRDDRYREAAANIAQAASGDGHQITVPKLAAVQPINPKDRDALGDGAFVEAVIWVPASQVEPIPS